MTERTTDHRPPKKSDTLEVRMPHATKRAFLEACRKDGRTASDAVRAYVEGYLRRAALRDRLSSQRSLAMTLRSPIARGGAIAAGLGALAFVALSTTPSGAQVDLRAAFERMDANMDGVITQDEFIGPGAAAGGGVMFVRKEAVDADASAPDASSFEQIWLPAVPPPVEGAAGHEVRIERQVDLDGHVTQSVEEGAAADAGVAAVFGRLFASYDGDADGAVSFAEYEARHREFVASTFNRLDADGDGRLGPDEFDISSLGLPPGPSGDLPDPFSDEAFARLDRDGDAVLTLEEFGGEAPDR